MSTIQRFPQNKAETLHNSFYEAQFIHQNQMNMLYATDKQKPKKQTLKVNIFQKHKLKNSEVILTNQIQEGGALCQSVIYPRNAKLF